MFMRHKQPISALQSERLFKVCTRMTAKKRSAASISIGNFPLLRVGD